MTTDAITVTAANHVLWEFDRADPAAGIGYPPGGFATALLYTISRADRPNRTRLAEGFPEYVAAYDLAQSDPNGLDRLRAIAQGVRS